MVYKPYALGEKKHVFVDWALIEPGYSVAWGGAKDGGFESPYGLRISAHTPRIDSEPLIRAEHPWEEWISSSTTIFEDEGRFRLYYPAYVGRAELKDSRAATEQSDFAIPWQSSVLAYAESDNGVDWVKPTIGAVEFAGSKDNNIVLTSTGTVFKDPSAPAAERYKLIFQNKEGDGDQVLGAVSSDGLQFNQLPQPILDGYVSDTQIVARFDPEKGRYVGYFRGWDRHEHGRVHGRRAIAYAETDTFESWPKPEPIVWPQVGDGPDADIYTNSYSPWPDGGDAHLTFPVFYQRRHDVTELHMMTSRDGTNWQRHRRGPIIPRVEPGTSGKPGLDWHTGVSAGCGLVSMRPDEHSLVISPAQTSHNNLMNMRESLLQDVYNDLGYICRATWRRDGFTSLEAETRGACTTYPLVFTGRELKVNAWTRFRGDIRIEIADASMETRPRPAQPVPGRTLAECDPIRGDVLDGTVTWNGQSDLSAWAGKQVRLRLEMDRARLHSLRFE